MISFRRFSAGLPVLLLLPWMGGCAETMRSQAAAVQDSPAEVSARMSYAGMDAAHDNRRRRLEELAAGRLRVNPQFYEYLVRKAEFPQLTGDQPILRVVFEERVFFDTAKAAMRAEALPVLRLIATALKEEQAASLFVVGHTDSRGGDAYNLDLSVKRAANVARSLAQMGVGHTRLWQIGFGKSVPLRPNDSEAEMAVNRRVEFILASKPEAVALWLSRQGQFLCAEDSSAELCHSAELPSTFTATPVQPVTQTAVRADVSGQTEVQLAAPQVISVTLQPPQIQNIGRPTQ